MNDITRIGIYIGSFAPIHNGHVNAARAFMDQMELHYLFVIPTYMPQEKRRGKGDEDEHRLKMCSLAFKDDTGVVVSDMMIERGEGFCEIDVLRELSRPDRRLFLLMGTDMALKLDTWAEPEEIFKLCYPTYVRREGDKLLENKMIDQNTKYLREYGKICRRIMTDEIELSSTQIRNKTAAGESIDDLVPIDVARYIAENGLYL